MSEKQNIESAASIGDRVYQAKTTKQPAHTRGFLLDRCWRANRESAGASVGFCPHIVKSQVNLREQKSTSRAELPVRVRMPSSARQSTNSLVAASYTCCSVLFFASPYVYFSCLRLPEQLLLICVCEDLYRASGS